MPNIKVIGKLSAVTTVAALFISFAQIASADNLDQSWIKICNKNNKGESVCNTLNNVISANGQPLTTINAVEYENKSKPKRIQITVPTARLVQEGVRIQIDDKPARKVDYLFCIGLSCMAEGALDNNLLNDLKKGKTLTVTSVNFEGDANPIQIPLDGFGKAFTGPAIKQDDLERQTRALRDDILQKEKEKDDKLKAAQKDFKK